MKKIISIAAICFVSLGVMKSQNMEERQVEEFSSLELEGPMNVILSQGEKTSVKIEADESLRKKIKTSVDKQTLEVTSEIHDKKAAVTVHITVKDIKNIETDGPINLTCITEIVSDKLKIETEGVGKTQLNLNVNKLDLDIDAVGSTVLSGRAGQLNAYLDGVGSLDALALVCRSAMVELSGVGSAELNVTDSLMVDASGVGSVKYKGNPPVKKIRKSGIGSVQPYDSNDDTGTNIKKEQLNEEYGDNDTTVLRLKNKNIVIIDNEDFDDNNNCDDDDFKHWSGFMLGINGYLSSSDKFNMPAGYHSLELDYAKSYVFDLNIFQKNIHLYENYLNLVTGLGFELNNYAFKNNIVLSPNTGNSLIDSVTQQPVNFISINYDSLLNYEKNKLKATYITVPLLFEWHSSANAEKAFHIAAGATAAYRIGSRTKQVYEQNGNRYKRVVKDDFHLAPFRVSATAMVGYGDFTVFANYGLTELFNKNEGPKLYPFSAGISLSF